MRRSARYIFWVLAITFVAWLALDYSGLIGQRAGSTGDIVGEVNGTEIRLQAFYDAVRLAQEQRRASGQEAPLTLEGQRELEDQVFDQLVRRILLEQEYRRRGIRISDQEVRRAAQTSPPPEFLEATQFQTEGRFDLEKYQRFLASGASPEILRALEARFREELPQIKLFQQLVDGLAVSDSQLWQMYRDRYDSVTIRLVRIRPDAAIPDSAVSVSESDVAAYYQRHRSEFRRAARAFLSYVALPAEVTAADSAAALERARAVRRELEEGADFAAVARRESADSGSRANGGDLGWVQRGQTVAPFDSAVFRLRVGTLSGIVTTRFGHHLIRVEAVAKDSARVHHILIPVTLSDERLALVEARADSLDRLAAEQARGDMLDTAAALLGLPVGRAEVREGERVMARGRPMPDAGVWAFTARSGETSHVIEAEGAYYLVRLDSLAPERIPTREEIKSELTGLALREKKRERGRELGDTVATRVRGGVPLADAARQMALPEVTVGPFTRLDPAAQLFGRPEVIGAAFGLGVGETAGPIVVEGGDVYFLQLVNRRLAERSGWEGQKDALRQQAVAQLRQRRITETLQSLRGRAEVVDRRREIERVQRELAERQPPVATY